MRFTAPMDRGGWTPIRDLADALKQSIDDTISLLRAMSYDPKDRCQVAMLYRREKTPDGLKWVNKGAAQARACQGHSIPWVVLDRLGVSIKIDKVVELHCLCHGTTFYALANILKGSLQPASHVDPAEYRRPGGRFQWATTKGTGVVGGSQERSVLMMLPYPYYDTRRYVGGARKDSEVYIFLRKEDVA